MNCDDPTGLRSWYQGLPAVLVIGATALGAIGGGGLLHIATRLPNALVGLAGVVLATLAALIVTDYMANWRRKRPGAGWTPFVLSSVAVGLTIVIVSDWLRWPFPAFIGLMTLTLVIGPVAGEVSDSVAKHAERWMQIGMAASFVGAILVGVAALPGWARLLAGAALLVGYGVFTSGFTRQVDGASGDGADPQPPNSPLLRLLPGDGGQRAVRAAGVGIVVIVVAIVLDLTVVVLAGGWLVIMAMIILSVCPGRLGLSVTMKRTVFWAGLGLMIVGGYQLYTTDAVGRSPWFVLFLIVTITLGGAWIVWRGATLFIVVVVGFAFVWGLFSHASFDGRQVSSAPRDVASARSVVAFGDSFISGEGAPRFFDGTDHKGDDRNECRRAPTAYPALIALSGGKPVGDDLEPIDGLTGDGLDFYACSGAKLDQVLDTTPDDGRPNNAGRDLPCDPEDELAVGQYPCSPPGVYGSRLQLDHLPGADPVQPAGVSPATELSGTELVLVSIGGNDVRFGDIVAGCLLPGSCAERREVWLDNVTALGPELTKGYTALRDLFDPDGDGSAAIVVMPYPLVLTEDTCDGSPLDSSEHEFIYEFTTVLNQQLAASARQAGVHFFADGPFAFEGHRLCEDGARAINLIGLQPTDGPLRDRLNPGSWTHNSMHPNPLGHRLTAQALTGWLNANDVLSGPHPDPDPAATSALLGVRTTRPYSVAPSTLAQLRESPSIGCDFEQLASFATRVSVFDEQPASGEERPFRVPVAGADPDATICATDAQGMWVPLSPTDDDGDGMNMASEQPTASIQDGQVFITGGRPAAGCPDADLDDGACGFQWILFAPPVETVPAADIDESAGPPAPNERPWSLRAVRYCSTDPDCENTFDEWTDAQISQAGRTVIPTVALIFLGGWLLALGLNLLDFRPFPGRVRRWVDSRVS